MLVERVTIVIHAAASVRFNNSLKYAIFVNTRATRDVCILAQSIKNLIVSQKVTKIMYLNNHSLSHNLYNNFYFYLNVLQKHKSLYTFQA